MNDSKTLVDQLREYASMDCIPLCVSEQINNLADRIEREYLPRPRFEDGEPVQFGDKFEA